MPFTGCNCSVSPTCQSPGLSRPTAFNTDIQVPAFTAHQAEPAIFATKGQQALCFVMLSKIYP